MPEIIAVGLEDHYENVKPNSRASADNSITVSRWGWLNCKSSNNIDFGRSNGLSIQLCKAIIGLDYAQTTQKTGGTATFLQILSHAK